MLCCFNSIIKLLKLLILLELAQPMNNNSIPKIKLQTEDRISKKEKEERKQKWNKAKMINQKVKIKNRKKKLFFNQIMKIIPITNQMMIKL
jgi:hypothetical protein